MTAFFVAQRGNYKETRITTHPNARAAEAFGGSYGQEWSGHVVGSDVDPDVSGPVLVQMHNALAGPDLQVKKFETRTVGKRRLWALLEASYAGKPHEAEKSAPPVEVPASAVESAGDEKATADASSGEEQESDMAAKKKAKKTKKTTTPKGERAPRGKGKAAGKVADFRPVREGTDRQKVLKLMNGSNTAEQIAAELGMNAKKVGTIVFCMSRDNGIGYEFGAKGQLKALFPGDNTYKDAVKKPASE